MAHHATCAVPSAVFWPANEVVVTPAVTYSISELVAATGSERRSHRLPASAHLATVILADAGTKAFEVEALQIREAQYAALLLLTNIYRITSTKRMHTFGMRNCRPSRSVASTPW